MLYLGSFQGRIGNPSSSRHDRSPATRGLARPLAAKSDEHSIILELFETDLEVGGAKKRALVLEDFQELYNVDRSIDYRGPPQKGKKKWSIFSAKEKYGAKLG